MSRITRHGIAQQALGVLGDLWGLEIVIFQSLKTSFGKGPESALWLLHYIYMTTISAMLIAHEELSILLWVMD